MNAAVIVAIISGLVALASAILSLYGVWLQERQKHRLIALQHQLEQERQKYNKEQLVRELMSKYREPLLRAAFDLQSRIYNIVEICFLENYYTEGTPLEKEYACENTLYVIAEYLGWVEIMRREVQFLDLGDVSENRKFVDLIDRITQTFLEGRLEEIFRIFRGEQRAIGEIMMNSLSVNSNSPSRECIGYANFVYKQKDPNFSRWFDKLRQDIEILANNPGKYYQRLIKLQHALVDLIDFLDPDYVRFPKKNRSKINR
ncbi:hypothetical protein ACE1B6_03795 [Aerosakkonemataceae cyanobacterium BLCC-F154]|uniref:Uncharacterized protein n=1 Tax=Floridaenema fluviatile BLCC-F154 TaxID=3153640 RepID=A0ABV4Y7Y6_9CYAN